MAIPHKMKNDSRSIIKDELEAMADEFILDAEDKNKTQDDRIRELFGGSYVDTH